MLDFMRVAGLVVVSGSIAWACSSNSTTTGTDEQGSSGAAGTAGAVAQGGSAGSGTSAGAGGSAGSSSTSGGSGGATTGSGGAAGATGSSGGAAGSSGGAAGAGGSSVSALGCVKDDDCIVAYAHASKGCCFRGCGSAFNKDYVAAEPCVTANEMTDPVPSSCDTGCLLCPGSLCQQVFGAVCHMGQCTSVTEYGPCTTDDDCVEAIDYASDEGACCSCPEITNKLVLANDKCVVPKGQPKPSGCDTAVAGICKSLGCPVQCPTFTALKCDKGMCMGS